MERNKEIKSERKRKSAGSSSGKREKKVKGTAEAKSSEYSKEAVLKRAHEIIEAKKINKPRSRTLDIMMENQLLALILQDPGQSTKKMVVSMNQEYGYGMDHQDVIGILQEWKLTSAKERQEMAAKVKEMGELMSRGLDGDEKSLNEARNLIKTTGALCKKKIGSKRLMLISLYSIKPVLKRSGDFEVVLQLGNAYADSVYRMMVDAVLNEIRRVQKKTAGNGDTVKESPEAIRIRELENTIATTNILLEELQNEFETQLAQSREKMKVEFFSSLNSEKYGMILDSVLELRKTANQLRRSSFQMPVELSGLLIFVTKMAEFVRDSRIDPMLKPGSLVEVNAEQAEFYDYEGTPFINNEQIKKVRVLSPGWIYRDQEIQIARPRVREEK